VNWRKDFLCLIIWSLIAHSQKKDGGAEIDAVLLLISERPSTSSAITLPGAAFSFREKPRQRAKEVSPEDGITKGNPGKRMFVLLFKQEIESFIQFILKRHNHRSLGYEKVTFGNQICIHKRTRTMRTLSLL
jgi:hypothetical protein